MHLRWICRAADAGRPYLQGARIDTFQVALALLLTGASGAAQASTLVQASLVRDFNTNLERADSRPQHFFAAGGKVYFSASRAQNGRELYAIEAGGQPYLVAELAPGGASSDVRVLGVVGGRLVVSARYGNTDPQSLTGTSSTYAVDPATGGATLLVESQPTGLGSFAGKVLLHTANDNTLLASDGTPQGTQRLLQGSADDAASVPRRKELICLQQDRILFAARRDGISQLWLSYGETLGTRNR